MVPVYQHDLPAVGRLVEDGLGHRDDISLGIRIALEVERLLQRHRYRRCGLSRPIAVADFHVAMIKIGRFEPRCRAGQPPRGECTRPIRGRAVERGRTR
jgi:hypothetical protein